MSVSHIPGVNGLTPRMDTVVSVERRTATAHATLLAVVVVWASAFSVIKALLDHGFVAEDIAILRYLVAAPGFAYLLWRVGGLPGLTRRPAHEAAGGPTPLISDDALHQELPSRRRQGTVLVAGLPFPAPDRLVHVGGRWPGGYGNFSYPDLVAMEERASAFDAVAVYQPASVALTGRGEPVRLARHGLLLGKVLALLNVVVLQLVVLVVVGLALGWQPTLDQPVTTIGSTVLAVAAGTWAFASLGLFVAGVLRAEATLALANLVYLLLMVGGGVVLPTSSYGAASGAIQWLPSAALGDAMRAALVDAAGEQAGPDPDPEQAELLRWLADDHFTFLGQVVVHPDGTTAGALGLLRADGPLRAEVVGQGDVDVVERRFRRRVGQRAAAGADVLG